MIDFNKSQSEKIMREHEEWLDINKNLLGGPEEKYIHNELRANLSKFRSLSNSTAFYELDLRYADFSKQHHKRISFVYCNFEGANFYDSSLYGYLIYANMRNTNLLKASLECDFQGTDFNGAKTDSETSFCNSILSSALNTESLKIPLACPEKGEFIAWKKCRGFNKNSEYFGDVIVKLLIPAYARRSSAVGKKCRCDAAKVMDIQDYSGKSIANECVAYPLFKADLIMYIVDRFVTPTEPFEENRFKECASGIHFFMDREDAVSYEV